ncbi:hypothetical protein like AT4G29090 [Hibiscus trionum]|uniref:Reverse transcriptase zinc-binding domain-containing protein n=1 Tax=Hibiscus trionum TaxID=183268 RepID=A0A9W7M6V5_HIBTR|nr:hypothetical protein like AT4G29090 [Hibiscus trionum]
MPVSIQKKISGLISRFLWEGSEDKSKIHWLSWSKVCSAKDNGGLGIINLEEMNRALIGKWIWKFGNDLEGMWRRVIVAKNPRIHKSLLPGTDLVMKGSWMWRDIWKSFTAEDTFGNTLRKNLGIKIGNGKNIKFWSDIWLGDTSLQVRFPRIFALATNKLCYIADVGRRGPSGWSWEIQLRRNVFDWERLQWADLLNCLNSVPIQGLEHDWIQWRGSTDGCFSVKSFRAALGVQNSDRNFWKNNVWLGFAPPKVEAFFWLVMNARAPVRAELRKRGISLIDGDSCPLCQSCPETVKHLFFNCFGVWQIWMSFCKAVGVEMVVHEDPKNFVENWNAMGQVSKKNWIPFIPFSVIWSVWLYRNDVVFKGAKVDWVQLRFMVKFRLATWMKAKFPNNLITLEDLLLDLNLADSIMVSEKDKRSQAHWTPPPKGFLKLNVDGATSVETNRAGIGGLLRNEEGINLWCFSEAVDLGPPSLAELEAVLRGIRFFLASVWCQNLRLIIESDCRKVVDWLNGVVNPPLLLRNGIIATMSTIQNKGWFVRWIPRGCNTAADGLAKKGIG